MLSSQEEQAERRRVLANDAGVRQQQREQGSTFHQHAQADADTPRGRFAQVTTATVIGSKADAASAYPAASSSWQIQLPDEPPLGLDNPALEPSVLASAQATGPTPADAPSAPLGDADVGPLSHSGDQTPRSHLPPGPARITRDVGSPVPYRRF